MESCGLMTVIVGGVIMIIILAESVLPVLKALTPFQTKLHGILTALRLDRQCGRIPLPKSQFQTLQNFRLEMLRNDAEGMDDIPTFSRPAIHLINLIGPSFQAWSWCDTWSRPPACSWCRLKWTSTICSKCGRSSSCTHPGVAAGRRCVLRPVCFTKAEIRAGIAFWRTAKARLSCQCSAVCAFGTWSTTFGPCSFWTKTGFSQKVFRGMALVFSRDLKDW